MAVLYRVIIRKNGLIEKLQVELSNFYVKLEYVLHCIYLTYKFVKENVGV